MKIEEIKTKLNSPKSQDRLKALTELRNYDTAIAIPLLASRVGDPEFLVRSFVAMGLGHKRSPESYKLLLEMMKGDNDYNVRAEAANSLSRFNEQSIPDLVEAFRLDENWLVRRSILAAMVEISPPQELLQVCTCALVGEDIPVREAAISALAVLAGTEKQGEALEQLLAFVSSESYRTRAVVALALRDFDDPQAKGALSYLSKDENPRVAAVAESSS
ncbi:MAG: HEAT repeat domain-containing protein [Cyanobacteriota bacterium]|nr:HEAT repeat domain-containing protein [Cyanobacteriota bacterium]